MSRGDLACACAHTTNQGAQTRSRFIARPGAGSLPEIKSGNTGDCVQAHVTDPAIGGALAIAGAGSLPGIKSGNTSDRRVRGRARDRGVHGAGSLPEIKLSR